MNDEPEPEVRTVARPGGAAPSPDSTVAAAAAPPARPSHLPDVPGYEVTREVARGGMGVVYFAHDPTFGRDVAVKVMHSGQDAERFVVESKVTAQLPHPGVPPVYDLGTLGDGRPFLAMKLIEGRTLADELKAAKPDDRPRLLGVFEAISQTVGFAHARGIIHRDLKPANIMVGAFGEVLVMDWGLAKQVGGADTLSTVTYGDGPDETRAGQVKGTPAYMAPEQARGEPVDARADVFALGGILCATLTGKAPFGGTTAVNTVRKAAAADLSDTFARLNACGADADLIAVARKCLAADPADRYADGEAVAAAVAAYRRGVEERLRQSERERAAAEAQAAEEVNTRREAEARAAEQRKRRRVQTLLAVAVALLIAAVAGVAWWRADERADRERERGEQARIDGERQTEQARIDGERKAEDARRAEKEAARLTQNAAALAEHVGRCEAALRTNDAKAAAAAMAEIGRRLPEGGGDSLAARVARCRADLALLHDLDAFDQFRWTPKVPDRAKESKFEPFNDALVSLPADRDVANRARAALAAAGVAVQRLDAAVERVRGSLLRERLVAVLDLCLVHAPDAGVLAALRAVDPDAFRGELRDAIVDDDRDRVTELSARPAALIQPTGFAAALGRYRGVSATRRLAVLHAAVATNPADLDLLLTLGGRGLEGGTNPAERLRWLQAAVAVGPDNVAANLFFGLCLMEMKEYDAATASLRRASRLAPGHPPTRQALMVALQSKGNARWDADDFYDAADAFREALSIDATGFPPVNPVRSTYLALGFVVERTGDPEGALAAYVGSVEASPDYAIARNQLAQLLATGPARVRDGKRAVEHATRACELTFWRTPGHIATLAAAHAEAGDFGKAVEYQAKALTHPAYVKEFGDAGRKRLALYSEKKPYHVPPRVPLAPPPRAVKR